MSPGMNLGMSKRILIVEDEIVVALFLEDLLGEFGYAVAGVVSHLDQALARELSGKGTLDFRPQGLLCEWDMKLQ